LLGTPVTGDWAVQLLPGGNPMKKQYKYFRVEQLDDVTMLTFTTRDFVKQLATQEMKAELVSYAREQMPSRLLVNFENVDRFSTELIGTMLSLKKLLSDNGIVKLSCLEPVHREVFRVLNLDGTVFEIYDTVDAARGTF
jgi:anti-anti-sigma regulatory factor